ncbi:uncharacterized protein AB675_1706 [Cyphellophora attinorum]|uniref:J domain-containing protein n=1 Tax=Cyphellophora attinorum TaxID=1664694 RepID=A0A0N1H3C1_9EURO|nr:uncharacterized protein AB675_1706 [Phialophora attinorum]KPI36024.1 hypothetical protein AB675_1706 [Phialophora attinorum]
MNKSLRSASPHEILGVDRHATTEQVKNAYKKLSLQLHPDKNPQNREWATAKFKELNAAYEIMSNPSEAGLAIDKQLEQLFNQFSQNFKQSLADFEYDITQKLESTTKEIAEQLDTVREQLAANTETMRDITEQLAANTETMRDITEQLAANTKMMRDINEKLKLPEDEESKSEGVGI